MENLKTILIVFLMAIAIFLSINFFKKTPSFPNSKKKLQVVTTLLPLYDFAKAIGQDKVEITLFLPPGVEAHSFEPKPNDVIRINKADVFIYTGKFMEVWADNVLKGVINKNLLVVDTSQGVKLIPVVFRDSDEQVGSPDPHYWLDFDNAHIMVENIAKAFEKKDPANKDFYKNNAKNYDVELTELDREYRSTLASCKTKEIIYGGHYAFGYLVNRYGLKYLAAQGVSPDSEPTANDLALLIEQIKKDNVKYVFYEELTSPKIAETISQETQAKLLLLNAAHNISKEQLEKGTAFLDIMKTNLANLKVGLECQ